MLCGVIVKMLLCRLHFNAENRLKKIKGQTSDVTSRDMLRSLTQAKKECWDRFLHDAQTSELFQSGDMDQRWDMPTSYTPTPYCMIKNPSVNVTMSVTMFQ